MFSKLQALSGYTNKPILPSAIELEVPIWNNYTSLNTYIDARRAGECFLLLASVITAASRLSSLRVSNPEISEYSSSLLWSSLELWILAIASFVYIIWAHSSVSKNASVSKASPSLVSFCPLSVRFHYHTLSLRPDSRDKRNSVPPSKIRKSDFGFIWMSVPKNYRESSDDGILTACLLGPLIASALLYSSLKRLPHTPGQSVPPSGWFVDAPVHLANSRLRSSTPLDFVALARFNILDVAILCSAITLVHVCSSFWLEAHHIRRANTPEGERTSVPRSEGSRFWYYVAFTVMLSTTLLAIKIWFETVGMGIWQHMNHFEVIACAMFYQFTLYVALRLAHHMARNYGEWL
ncbi:hypothetical protein ONZ45_g16077 [Pleurotus djamor]|nr:hypothetical protein ONZ45_g16077 [Pleurotus djamor]